MTNPNTCNPPKAGCDDPVPETLYAHAVGYSGCGSIGGIAELKWQGGVWHGSYDVLHSGTTYTFSFILEYTGESPNPWKLTMQSFDPDCASFADTDTATCVPFSVGIFDFGPLGTDCGGCGDHGGFEVTVNTVST